MPTAVKRNSFIVNEVPREFEIGADENTLAIVLDSLLRDFDVENARFNSRTDQNTDMTMSQLQQEKRAAGAQMVDRQNSMQFAAKPTLTNTQLLNLLTSTAKDLGTAGKDNNFGYGLVQPLKAITGQ